MRSVAASPTSPARAPAGTSTGLRVVALTLVTLCCFAANSLLCRAALATGRIDAASFTAVRIGSGALVLAALARGRGTRPGGGSWVSALALFAYAATFSLAYLRIGAGAGALLLFAAVQASMIGWSIARGARPFARQWVGIACALAGLVALLAPGLGRPDPAGAALMIAAGVAWGCYSLRGRGARDPLATTADNFARAVPFAVALLVVATTRSASPSGVALALASGALASGLGYSLWYGVLPWLGATRAAAVQLAVPILAALAAVAWLHEPLTLRLVASGLVVLAGIGLVAVPRRPR